LRVARNYAPLFAFLHIHSAELLPNGVRVNVVSPGPIAAPIYGKLGLDAAPLAATAAQIQSQIPLGRFGTSEEIASTVLHLIFARVGLYRGNWLMREHACELTDLQRADGD
jgi:NAD(P)-dependent dehydrogenase (short-subunit alcohol dehydrogenase family)